VNREKQELINICKCKFKKREEKLISELKRLRHSYRLEKQSIMSMNMSKSKKDRIRLSREERVTIEHTRITLETLKESILDRVRRIGDSRGNEYYNNYLKMNRLNKEE